MSKEQTPIEKRLDEILWNEPIEVETGIRVYEIELPETVKKIIIEFAEQEKRKAVLEAQNECDTKWKAILEREVPKAFDSYPLTKLDIKTGKQYFETKVKPEYE